MQVSIICKALRRPSRVWGSVVLFMVKAALAHKSLAGQIGFSGGYLRSMMAIPKRELTSGIAPYTALRS